MIEVSGLRKEYGGFLAVRDNTFTVETGEIFGIVGPNGAGKTTTLKTVAGLLEPTAGEVRVAGGSPQEPSTRTELGFLPEESPIYEDMTARSYLRFFADLYDVPTETARERIESTLDDLELDHRDRRLGDTSKGMKRKVAIARSLVNDPAVLVYDEPASGLDPLTTNYVLEFVRELADRGKTVLFSAHNLYHVESVCDRVLIMNEGDTVTRGTMDEIRTQYGDTTYRVFTTVPVEGAEPVAASPTPSGEHTQQSERYRVDVPSMDAVERVRESCMADGGRVADIRTLESSLEEIFLDVAGQPMPGSRRVGDEPFAGRESAGETDSTRASGDGTGGGESVEDGASGGESSGEADRREPTEAGDR